MNCTCEDPLTTAGDCAECRESWVWSDRVPMTYYSWRSRSKEEPGVEACARLNFFGWADIACDYKLKYICERYIGECIFCTD